MCCLNVQLPDFNVVKPSAYSYDFALLGVITIVFGLIGLPPINGVLPQVSLADRLSDRLSDMMTVIAIVFFGLIGLPPINRVLPQVGLSDKLHV